ncbi:LysM peptidoglycan-binding domain-containing protein [Arthrobacter sp. Y-9]|uniref:LysM peptidoglycan-binding domain-containing protein n=1 Tax=Arthrobacter sp. Y-9 TaxID=3039385 RepID=UPI00241C3DD4|nr:LysM peptidoglycan-binding domain-containing protein [Arthrobacter sp. Y-9]WFR83433.1 LysM peptidoglycan-binding domain-containing protein [Arthrobacter sp. Y-9]
MVKNVSEEAFTPGVGASSAHSGHGPAHREDAPVDAVPAGAEPIDGEQTSAEPGEGVGAHVAVLGPDDAGSPDEAPGETEVLAAVVVPERPREVTVDEGETLESIAARWGVDAGELAALNAWFVPNPGSLFPGQVLTLPD